MTRNYQFMVTRNIILRMLAVGTLASAPMACSSGISPNKVAKPETFLLDGNLLGRNKEKLLRNDPALKAALAEFLVIADKALENGPYSVTSKSKTPPSGDKHDYMSVGPYWWPDSSKVNGLPYIRKDGQVNPERHSIKDAEYHGKLCSDIYLLGVAWYFTSDEKYAAHATKLLSTWFLNPATKMNPNLNFGQSIPGRTEGRGIGIIDTRNLAKLIDGVQLLKSSRSLPNGDYVGVKKWYQQFLTWMTTSPIGRDEADESNNHGTWYDVQTVSMALFTDKPELARKMLEEQTMKRIDRQLKPDGRQPLELARTLSWNYSTMNLNGFFELARLAENVNIDLWNYVSPGGKSLKNAFIWMLPYAKGQKVWTEKQIKEIQFEGFARMARVVSVKYPDVDSSGLLGETRTESVTLLTGADF